MDEFTLTEEQKMLREMTRDFVNNEIKPIASKIDSDEKIPAELIKKMAELMLNVYQHPNKFNDKSLELIQDDLPLEPSTLHRRLLEAETLVDEAMERIGTLAQGLRPPALDTIGLNLTLDGLCHEFARRSHIAIDYCRHVTSSMQCMTQYVLPATIRQGEFLLEEINDAI